MNTADHNRTIALAGMFQAVRLVQQTAAGEYRDESATNTCISSIFNTAPEAVTDVFGGTAALRTGLEVLVKQLGKDNRQRDMILTRYAITLLHLERKLSRQPAMLDEISTGIARVREQVDFFDLHHPTVIAGLADVYKRTISTLRPRIMVSGEQLVLANQDSKNMVRALLLAAIRAAVLWRQCGGNRVKLIFQRKALLACCESMLGEI
jgi:high frequency lysogenization protein